MKDKISITLRVLLVLLLFAVPISLAMSVWYTPALELNKFVVGTSTINLTLSIAEVIFLVRAAIFPREGKKWWRDW